MNKTILLISLTILTFSVVDAQAETWDCGEVANKVTCTLSNGVFTVSGNGNMKNFGWGSTPWWSKGPLIKKVNIETGVTSIGDCAFVTTTQLNDITIPEGVTYIGASALALYQVTSLTLPSTITEINGSAFSNTDKLDELIIPDKWRENSITISPYAFGGLRSNTQIICQGAKSNCVEVLKDFILDDDGNCTVGRTVNNVYTCRIGLEQIVEANISQCKGYYGWNGVSCVRKNPDGGLDCNDGYNYDSEVAKCLPLPKNCSAHEDGFCTTCNEGYLTNDEGTCTPEAECNNGLHKTADGGCAANDDVNCSTQTGNKCTECKSGYLEQGGSCVTSCGVGYRQVENWCNRIRYTPAEAAKVLTDDNNNSVTITFKK